MVRDGNLVEEVVRIRERRGKTGGWVKGQISVEYVMIIAFTFAVLIPGIYFFYSYSQGSSSSLSSSQYNKLGQEMLSTSFKALAQGSGSWLTLDAIIPVNVEAINITGGGKELVVQYDTSVGATEAVFFSDVTLTTDPAGDQQDGSVFLNAVHSGRTTFRFTASSNDTVTVQETASS